MNPQLLPPSFLFQYQISIPYSNRIPGKKGRLLPLDDSASLFVPSTLNRAASPISLKMAWNSEGLGILLEVRGKTLPPAGRRSDLKNSDLAAFFVDTRHTANVHRATEYCTSCIVLPSDEDADDRPSIQFPDIAQQRSVRRDRNEDKCRLQTTNHADGYSLEVWLPAMLLPGFHEIADIGHLGFYCVVNDTEVGAIPFSIGDDFPVGHDPSTWIQLELKAEA
jgi:hypothetical protein